MLRAGVLGVAACALAVLSPAWVTPSAASTAAAAPIARPAPRLTSVGVFTKIYAVPTRRGAHLGYVHYGQSVGIRRAEPVRNADCPAGWYAIAPRGFVCNDTTVVLEASGRALPAYLSRLMTAQADTPPAAGALPFHYALSLGTPMYGRVPSADERARYEPWLRSASARMVDGNHDGTLPAALSPAASAPPWYLEGGALSPDYVGGRDARLLRKVAPRDSLISFQSSFEWEGKRWLVTPELSVVPAERVRELTPSAFHGVTIDAGLPLPIAWIRKTPRPKYRADKSGAMIADRENWPLRSAVALSGARVEVAGRVYLETRETGAYLAESDATVVNASETLPRGVRGRDKWLQISLSAGTLTAYEGGLPVFATLISPGRGGAPSNAHASNRELVRRAASPLGTYRILYKERYSVMSPDRAQKKFFIEDVPHIQYFRGPFALHAAYWHDDFGEPKSGGCINLSPEDAARIFAWTDPPLPSGWHAVQSSKANGLGTRVQIVR